MRRMLFGIAIALGSIEATAGPPTIPTQNVNGVNTPLPVAVQNPTLAVVGVPDEPLKVEITKPTLAIYLLKISTTIADALNISPKTAASICSWLSLMPESAPQWVPFAPGLLVSYIMRFLVGVGFIFVYPQFITMVGDYTYDKDRGKGMALNGMMMGIAAILVFGIFGAIMKQRGVPAGFTTAMLFAAIGAVMTAIFVKDRMPEKPKEKQGIKDVNPVLKKSTALKTAYVCSLITRADIVVLATYLLTWGTSYGISTGLTKGAAMFKATFPMMVMGVITFLVFPIIAVTIEPSDQQRLRLPRGRELQLGKESFRLTGTRRKAGHDHGLAAGLLERSGLVK